MVAAVSGVIGLALSFGVVEKAKISREPVTVPELLSVTSNRDLLVVSGLAILAQFLTFATVYGFTPVAAKISEQTTYSWGS